jgi:hypothetical protein
MTTTMPMVDEAVKRVGVEAALGLVAIALSLLPAVESYAASPEAWQEFRIDVERACLALAVSLDRPKVIVNPFGTESYGVAMLIDAQSGGSNETYACVYEKRTKRAELSGPFDTPIQ